MVTPTSRSQAVVSGRTSLSLVANSATTRSRAPQPRPRLLFVVSMLALLTGIVLAETRLVALTPVVPVTDAARLAANTDLVRRFYAAVNDALRTGDTASLDHFITPDFAARTSWTGVPPTRDGLVRYLRSLHTVYPGLRLVVFDLVAQDDRIVARVGVAGSSAGDFIGRSVSGAGVWGAVDVFRIDARRIAQLWSDAPRPALLEPLATAPLALTDEPCKVWTLARRTYTGGIREHVMVEDGPTVLWVESGVLRVTIAPNASHSARLLPSAGRARPDTLHTVAPGEYVKLGPGEGLVVAGLDTFETRSDDSTTTVALAVTLGIPTPVLFGLPTAPVPPPGVDVTVLAGGAAHLPTGPVTLGLGRVVLPPAAALPAHRVTGAELVAVEAGTLSLTVDKGNASFDIASAAPIATLSSAEVTTGHGFLATRDTTVEYRNTSSDSLVLLVVTLTPTESAALTATAATGAAVKTTCGTDQRRADWSGQ